MKLDARASFLALAVTSVIGCAKPQSAAISPPATTATAATAATGATGARIVFPDRSAVSVEIASDPETRTQGLMYRDHLPDRVGMIFLFPSTDEYPFWMKNTLIPLDLIWIDEGHRIVHVAHDVPPCKADPCPDYPPKVKSRAVLEVAAGVAAKHQLKEGDLLVFEGLDQAVVK
ncbi:MAG: DUF192 domain-containing protein [Thermoanaerobaculia bacterium]